jgi:hypothetical protein
MASGFKKAIQTVEFLQMYPVDEFQPGFVLGIELA